MTRRRGIVCPACGGPTVVHTTRQTVVAAVLRYRRCVKCGCQMTTWERISEYRPTNRMNLGESATDQK